MGRSGNRNHTICFSCLMPTCLLQLPDHILGQYDEDDSDVPRNVADIDDCSVNPEMKDTYFGELKVSLLIFFQALAAIASYATLFLAAFLVFHGIMSETVTVGI